MLHKNENHDFAISNLNALTTMATANGETTGVVFEISEVGKFAYYCTISGHSQAGMEGNLLVTEP